MHHSFRLPRQFRPGLVLAIVFTLAALGEHPAVGCETPVYRYAMYRWQPAPYEIYCFHRGERDSKSHEVEAAVEELATGSDNRANVVFLPVDLTEDPDLLSVPPDVKAGLLKDKQTDSLAIDGGHYLISTPYGVSLYDGPLDSKTVQRLADSPARKSLAAQLETGKVGVFLFLAGDDATENEVARGILEEVVADVAAGEISLYEAPSTAANDSDGPQHELGMIEVARNSEEEDWLVRSLLTIEPDLKADRRPMVFLVYGRGRALLPYIGPGISRENLLREVEFISGACSCTVKEQNPGIDLLVRYDWESAAAALAEKIGAEEGNESSLGGDVFLPELFIPSSGEALQTEDVTRAHENGEGSGGSDPQVLGAVAANQDASADRRDPATQDSAGGSETGDSAEADSGRQAAPTEVARLESPAITESPGENRTLGEVHEERVGLSVMLMIGAGLAGAVVILFGITLVVLRPQ